jgi:non-specific serine/threonine protein kinase
MSSPATPSHELLMEPEEWRFEDTGAACEWAEDYRPGGFHPVNIGDTFANDQYKVIRKLGEGSFSTVWLVASKRYVSSPFPDSCSILTCY